MIFLIEYKRGEYIKKYSFAKEVKPIEFPQLKYEALNLINYIPSEMQCKYSKK